MDGRLPARGPSPAWQLPHQCAAAGGSSHRSRSGWPELTAGPRPVARPKQTPRCWPNSTRHSPVPGSSAPPTLSSPRRRPPHPAARSTPRPTIDDQSSGSPVCRGCEEWTVDGATLTGLDGVGSFDDGNGAMATTVEGATVGGGRRSCTPGAALPDVVGLASCASRRSSDARKVCTCPFVEASSACNSPSSCCLPGTALDTESGWWALPAWARAIPAPLHSVVPTMTAIPIRFARRTAVLPSYDPHAVPAIVTAASRVTPTRRGLPSVRQHDQLGRCRRQSPTQTCEQPRLGTRRHFQRIYSILSPVVLGYLRAKGTDDPEGATSDVFLSVLPRLRELRGGVAWASDVCHVGRARPDG